MKNFIDSFFEVIHKNTQKRRRMFSLLLVLSIFVTSGVVWILRGTGITMVNVELCGIEAHTHTEECYESTLICELQEDDTHTHTDECYESTLICGKEEHIHIASCYSDQTDVTYTLLQNTITDTVEMNGVQVYDSPISADALTEVINNQLAKQDHDNPPPLRSINPQNVPTLNDLPDTRKAGITINLFDYGNDALDNDNNLYESLKTVGINTGRSRDQDIVFMGRGTPNNNGSPDHNNYSGGQVPVQGIVQNTLTNGYPTLSASEHHSLAYLFDPTLTTNYRDVYTNVANLLRWNATTHTYYFNSDDNYAYYNTSQGNNGDFVVYDSSFKNSHNDPKSPGIGFFPFNDYNDTQKSVQAGGGYNHHFGMTLSADFKIPNNTALQYEGRDVIFEYSGDDDMWVFVDGILVLDVGGIHQPVAGVINFTTGLIMVQDESNGASAPLSTTELAAYADGLFTISNMKWTNTTLATTFNNAGKTWDPTAEHHVDIFYLERGGVYSNLAMQFNLPIVKTISVAKDLNALSHSTTEYDDKEYSFRLHVKSSATSDDDDIYTGSVERNGQYIPLGNDGIFKLKPGEDISFHALNEDKYYYVEEMNVNSSIFSDILVNDEELKSLTADSGTQSVCTPPAALTESLDYNFTNQIRETKTDLEVKKYWNDGESTVSHSDAKALFHLIRTDESGNEELVTVGGRRTFSLTEENNWYKKFTNLITRYGEHTYTYSVEEVNVPIGYSVSYSEGKNGTTKVLNITNVITTESEISVKKEWLDAFGNAITTPPQSVTVQLYRIVQKVGPSEKTDLTIKVIDEAGNEQKWTTSEAYLDGTIEFAIDMPEDITLKRIGTAHCSCSESDGIFTASGIDEGAEVSIYVSSDSGNNSAALLVHDSFENGLSNWSGRGDASVALSTAGSYSANHSLSITGRKAMWNGAQYELDTDIFKPGKSYSFSIKVQNTGDDKYTYKLSLLYYINGEQQFGDIASVQCNGHEWATLENQSYTIPANAAASPLYLIVEGDSSVLNQNNRDIRVDELVIAAANNQITVTETTGDVTLKYAPPYTQYSFTNSTQDWTNRYGGTVTRTTDASYATNSSLVVKGRNNSYEGMWIKLPDAYPEGGTFSFTAYAMAPTAGISFKMTLQNNNNSFSTIAEEVSTAGGWVKLSNPSFTIPSGDRMLYVETPNSTANFYLDEVVIAPAGTNVNVIPQTGKVVFGELCDCEIFEDTSYGPLIPIGSPTDAAFGDPVTLSSTNNWLKTWSSEDLKQNPAYTYTYYVKETSTLSDYVTYYLNTNVSSNTSSTPIRIQNVKNAYVLPTTGGGGPSKYLGAGLFLILLSFLIGSFVKRRERGSRMM